MRINLLSLFFLMLIGFVSFQTIGAGSFPGWIVQEIQWRAGAGVKPAELVLKKGQGKDRTIYRFPKLPGESFYAPCGSFHYNPDSPDWIDAYAHPQTACSLLALVQKWKGSFCPSSEEGCRLAWGDISHITDKYFSGHKTHTHGYCIDLRPFRKGPFRNAPLWYTDPEYDQATTRKFLKLIQKDLKAKPVYFNDPMLIREGLAKRASGHDNHIHFCFNPASERVRSCAVFQLNTEACPYFSENRME